MGRAVVLRQIDVEVRWVRDDPHLDRPDMALSGASTGPFFSGSALAPLDHPQAEAGGRSGGRGTSWSTKRAPHFGSYSPAGASSSAPGAVASEAVEQLV